MGNSQFHKISQKCCMILLEKFSGNNQLTFMNTELSISEQSTRVLSSIIMDKTKSKKMKNTMKIGNSNKRLTINNNNNNMNKRAKKLHNRTCKLQDLSAWNTDRAKKCLMQITM